MPYGWHTEAAERSDHNWCRYGKFKTNIRNLFTKNISVQAVRDEVMSVLGGIRDITPFSSNTRFPNDQIWVDLDHPFVIDRFRIIMGAASYKDRQNEKARGVPEHVEVRLYSNIEDAKVAYYRAIQDLLTAHVGCSVETMHIYGFYVRVSFESESQLTWTE